MSLNPTVSLPSQAMSNQPRFVSTLESRLKDKPKKKGYVQATTKMPIIKPASASRKNRPQNSKVFTTQSLPHGGNVSYFAVPGRDGHRAQSFFTDSRNQDLESSQRSSYIGKRPSSGEKGNTQRYGCTQQPWAMATLGNGELGIVPELYETRVRKHMQTIRRARTAPESLSFGESTRRHFHQHDGVDVDAVVRDPALADCISAWMASASRLERTVVQQMLNDVSAKMADYSRPATRMNTLHE